MCSNSGECFIVLPPLTELNEVIYGRNSYRPEGEVSEVVYSTDKERVWNLLYIFTFETMRDFTF